MSYESIYFKEVMLCRMKCLVGGHEDTLDVEMFYWKYFLWEIMYYMMACFTGGMCYRKSGIT